MRHVARGSAPAPASLNALDELGRTEFDRASAYYLPANGVAPKKAYDFEVYRSDDVKERLDELYSEKCAYCETCYAVGGPMDVEHYRPKGGVEGTNHRGYWWLAAEWTNLLPSCASCNRRRRQKVSEPGPSLSALLRSGTANVAGRTMSVGKRNSFPIAGPRANDQHADIDAELPLLLNPCVDRPEDHLLFNLDPALPVSLMFPKMVAGNQVMPAAGNAAEMAAANGAIAGSLSVRGAVSIQVLGLNRLPLVQERTRLLRQLEFFGQLIVDLANLIERINNRLAQGPDALLTDVAAKLTELTRRIYAELTHLKRDDQPHSAMVASWIEAFKLRVRASGT